MAYSHGGMAYSLKKMMYSLHSMMYSLQKLIDPLKKMTYSHLDVIRSELTGEKIACERFICANTSFPGANTSFF